MTGNQKICCYVAAGVLVIVALSVGLSLALKKKTTDVDLDLNLDISEDEFLEVFGLPPVDDAEQKLKRAQTLKQHQQEIIKNNKAYLAGERTWYEGINEFSDIPYDYLIATHTGLIEAPEQQSSVTQNVLGESLTSNLPSSYDSVSRGYVSPVKSQGYCGSCVAFATIALVETCFKKKVRTFGDYSEQHLLDCASGARGYDGCDGAWPTTYASWLADRKPKLASEAGYPYTARVGTCRTDYSEFYQGAKISESAYYRGNKETLKALVYEHGAVLVGMAANDAFFQYRGGVFAGCSQDDRPNHAVVVVGYGTDYHSGVDYWLVKNSHGTHWGDQGYMRIQRGVNMCGIETTTQVVLTCG